MDEPNSGSRGSRYEQRQLMILVLAAVLLLGFFYFRWHRLKEPVTDWTPPSDAPMIRVEVKGDVVKPGVYEIALGATVQDLLHQSGQRVGLAELPAAWRDMPLLDGASVEIWQGEDGKPHLSLNQMKADTLGLLFLSLDLNSASEEDLKSLPGIGEATAKSIIEYRQTYGPFKRLEDLKTVRGIGDKTIESLRYRVVVGQPSEGKKEP